MTIVVAPVLAEVAPKKVMVLPANPSIDLPCKASAFPKAKISWARRGAALPDSAVITSDGSLRIAEFSKEDNGVYVCRAENEHGYVERATDVSLYNQGRNLHGD